MVDRPILFSAPMVRALLAGRKVQTRRLAESPLRHCVPGDRLWVKETWQVGSSDEGPCLALRANDDRIYPEFTGEDQGAGPSFDYDAHPAKAWAHGHWIADVEARGPWSSALHMPRWASRLTLEVERVHSEPLQAISPSDAIDEGWPGLTDSNQLLPVSWYRDLWRSLHDKDGQRWQDNPNVLVLVFSVQRGNIDGEGMARG